MRTYAWPDCSRHRVVDHTARVEQRIGSNSQPLAAAAVDPSHIPGLTAPVSVTKEKQEEPEDSKPTESAEPAETEETDEAAPKRKKAEADAEDAKDSEDEDEEASAHDSASEDGAEPAEDSDRVADDEAAEGAEGSDGPVFEAADRRARIVADSAGVRLKLDDQECEFGWDEIGAIETESPRFGKRFTVTVHTPDRRWYPIEIEAKAKSDHKTWETAIDEVLDAYFEDEKGEKAEEAEKSAP